MDEQTICMATIQTTNEWINFIMKELGLEDKQLAFQTLTATLLAVRDQLEASKAAEFGMDLPVLLRILYCDGWDPLSVTQKALNQKDFFLRIKENIGEVFEIRIEKIVRAVFKLLTLQIEIRSIKDIRGFLPERLNIFWP